MRGRLSDDGNLLLKRFTVDNFPLLQSSSAGDLVIPKIHCRRFRFGDDKKNGRALCPVSLPRTSLENRWLITKLLWTEFLRSQLPNDGKPFGRELPTDNLA